MNPAPRAPRRLLLPVLTLALAAGLLSSCGQRDGTESGAEADKAAPGSTFPVTVEHKFGSTTIPSQPMRVVSVGLTEQDVLLELGVKPIAVTEWYGEQPYATWPWARKLLGDAKPKVLHADDGPEYEKIAELKPDLILGTNAGLTAKSYRLLSAIAPTVTSVKGSTQYFSSWQDQTLQIARALGREKDGRAIVDDVEASYRKVAAAHPEWQGKTATFSQGDAYGGELYVYPDGLNTDFLTDLGYRITPGLEKYAPDSGSQAQISGENVNLIDANVIVFATEDQKSFDGLQKFATVGNLDAVKEDRSVYTDATLAGAIYFLTPLSLKYVLAELTPLLEKAANGQAPRSFPTT